MSGTSLASRVSQSVRSVARIGEATGVVAGTGVGWLLGNRPPAPALLRQTFERLGATYIKLGQFIASSPSIFPREYVEEFQLCLDRTPPVPWRVIRRRLRDELGDTPEKLFAAVDPEPLASASIAQVHAARLKSGEDVVLKIQKPGVERIVATDLGMLALAARLTELVNPAASHASVAAIVDEIRTSMLEECDFRKEADNLREFREFLDRTGNTVAVAPRVYDAWSTRRVLVMERLYGAPLTDLDSLRRMTPDPEAALLNALNTWYASLMECREFHADLHAGNLLVLDDGRVGFIDFGIVGRIRESTWKALFSLAESVPRADWSATAEALATMGATRDQVDTAALSRDLAKLADRLDHMDAQPVPVGGEDRELNGLLMDLVAAGRRHGIRFPREFTLLVKQFLYFDRYVRLLSPGLDLVSEARLGALASQG
jgi:predicted unusual protein kinase regulating ubiquinone biosynthesis (AarF/ABC1/UbiB family)